MLFTCDNLIITTILWCKYCLLLTDEESEAEDGK